MSIPKKTHEPILQNEEIVKKSQKHDANLQKNSTLYFQIGLIVCLLAAYGLLEMKFEKEIPKITEVIPRDITYVDEAPIFKPEVAVVNEPVEQPKVKTPTEEFKEVPNDTPDIFKDDTSKPAESKPVLNPGDVTVIKPPVDIPDLPFDKVEVVPVYPGCENKKTNEDRRKCMSDKITKLIQRKFDTGLGGELGLSGKQVIRTQFKIDKTGHVIDVKVRGTHPDLENEAKRVINIIPEMKPGKQGNNNVGVIYSLPIIFEVQN
jgi:periplasmic protein TonB